ncbi:hypothetical protein SNOG_11903 [Parastagonospora nodorum SN15]|uniref:Uncharacterized protein n=1 Tax=Phaeosphaeria nodorum (strain SN15 / ATCC MYA-4574 / FGSC 10173) TaxID=321614 RepID=Q0U8L1_PHANO|nr:hypothetical protein SNOG_11903 [Parastagonospora nodorum SN15]EAT80947.1 hypothetical protein SNOG_11903 [Parastagonospora nodorum SN15]
MTDGYKTAIVERWRVPNTSDYLLDSYSSTNPAMAKERSPRRSCNIETTSSVQYHAISYT